ncbi:MAG: preprotein translocase subunit SecG [Bacteroidales bacterium]|nr:preprotein translocase subunit SecG [Bacteroidales bacterium]MCF8386309.1 preprotein translocase subunit SecG [Bacteroidales bacterium]MCF8398186.1 preprotein translocase subunit SecG [Bacteroidales bacterium]
MGAYIFISVLILIACVLLILVVLVQNSKGGGLASNFSGSNQFMGVRKTADFLEKSTWTLAIVLLVLSLATIFVIPRNGAQNLSVDTELRDQIDESSVVVDDNFQLPPPQQENE